MHALQEDLHLYKGGLGWPSMSALGNEMALKFGWFTILCKGLDFIWQYAYPLVRGLDFNQALAWALLKAKCHSFF